MSLLSWPVVLVLSKLQKSPLSKEILNGQFHQSTNLLETMFPKKAAGWRDVCCFEPCRQCDLVVVDMEGRCSVLTVLKETRPGSRTPGLRKHYVIFFATSQPHLSQNLHELLSARLTAAAAKKVAAVSQLQLRLPHRRQNVEATIPGAAIITAPNRMHIVSQPRRPPIDQT